jgi:hypothetical protein
LKYELISPIEINIDYFGYCLTYFSQLNGEEDDNYLVDFDETASIIRNLISIYVSNYITKVALYIYSRNEIIRYLDLVGMLLL